MAMRETGKRNAGRELREMLGAETRRGKGKERRAIIGTGEQKGARRGKGCRLRRRK